MFYLTPEKYILTTSISPHSAVEIPSDAADYFTIDALIYSTNTMANIKIKINNETER